MTKSYREEEQPEPRAMPVISPDKYLSVAQADGLTPQDKEAFLTVYYQSGNQTAAAKSVGRSIGGFKRAMGTDLAFASDFNAVKAAMKHNLEQTMYQNGLKEKGYMDRITWLRKNFPKEYNPAYVDKDTNPADAIKELSNKLDDYQLIPKKSIIESEDHETT